MFAWKRRRREGTAESRDLSPLPCSASPMDVPSVGLTSGGSEPCGRLPSLGGVHLATPPCSSDITALLCSQHSSEPCSSSPHTSIELAAAPSPAPHPGSVRSKAAYFEALCRSNTTVHIQCSADGMQHATFPDLPDTSSCSRGGGGSCVPLADDPGVPPADMDEEVAASWQDYSEVHLLLRMPRPSSLPAAPAASSKYGGVAEMEELVERLHAALEVKEAQRKAAVDALARRSSEAENLQRVVRELSESRAKEVSQRVTLQARYGELQSEYARMLRIADLSRTVSKENVAATSRTRSELRRVQSELHATKTHATSLHEKNKKARVENALLKEKVHVLERRVDFEGFQESECKKHLTRNPYRVVETY